MSEDSVDEIVAEIVRYARSGRFLTASDLRRQVEVDFPESPFIEAAMKKAATALINQHQQ